MTNTSTAKQPLKWLRICIAQFDPLLDSYVDVDVVHRDQARPIGAALADLYRSRKVCNDRAFRKPSDTFFWVFDPKNDPRFILQSRDYIHGLSGAMSLEYLCNVVVLRAVELALPDEHGRALVVIDPFEYTGRLYEKSEPAGYHLSLLGLAADALKTRVPAPAPVPAPEDFFSLPARDLTVTELVRLAQYYEWHLAMHAKRMNDAVKKAFEDAGHSCSPKLSKDLVLGTYRLNDALVTVHDAYADAYKSLGFRLVPLGVGLHGADLARVIVDDDHTFYNVTSPAFL